MFRGTFPTHPPTALFNMTSGNKLEVWTQTFSLAPTRCQERQLLKTEEVERPGLEPSFVTSERS